MVHPGPSRTKKNAGKRIIIQPGFSRLDATSTITTENPIHTGTVQYCTYFVRGQLSLPPHVGLLAPYNASCLFLAGQDGKPDHGRRITTRGSSHAPGCAACAVYPILVSCLPTYLFTSYHEIVDRLKPRMCSASWPSRPAIVLVQVCRDDHVRISMPFDVVAGLSHLIYIFSRHYFVRSAHELRTAPCRLCSFRTPYGIGAIHTRGEAALHPPYAQSISRPSDSINSTRGAMMSVYMEVRNFMAFLHFDKRGRVFSIFLVFFFLSLTFCYYSPCPATPCASKRQGLRHTETLLRSHGDCARAIETLP